MEGCRANGETWLNGERGGGTSVTSPGGIRCHGDLGRCCCGDGDERRQSGEWHFWAGAWPTAYSPVCPEGGAAEMIVCRVTTLLWLCALYFQAPMHHSACTWVCVLMPACMLCVSVVHCISNMYWAIRERAAASHLSGGPSAASAATPRTF